jgi:hypothetical protein
VPRVRSLCASTNARAGTERQARGLADLAERECIELWCDLALEPRLIALARMLARPAAVAAMHIGDRLTSRAVHDSAAAARCRLCDLEAHTASLALQLRARRIAAA